MRFTDVSFQTTMALHTLQVIAAFSILAFWVKLPLALALLVAPAIALLPLTGPLLGVSSGLMVWSWM